MEEEWAAHPAPPLVVVGAIGVDLLVRLPRLPGPNDRLSATEAVLSPGGMGGNVAAGYARLGGVVHFAGGFARDADGRTLRAGLAALGVDLTYARDLDLPHTPRGLILVDENGERAIIGGWSQIIAANALPLAADPIPVALTSPHASRWALDPAALASSASFALPDGPFASPGTACYCQGILAPAVLPYLPDAVPLSIDVERNHLSGLAADAVVRLLARAEMLFGNTGSLTDVAHQLGLSRAEQLAPFVRRAAIITRGEAGCTVVERDGGLTNVPGYTVAARDTTGAGDCFAAAFLYAAARTGSLARAARFANIAAALSTRALGARGALPTAVEVMRHSARTQP